MSELSLRGFAELLERTATGAEEARHRGLEKAGGMVVADAKSRIGTYDGNDWPTLADSTVEERVRRGYTPDEPLLRDGTLRGSITHTVNGDTLTVGSELDIAAYQELGTDRIPPRPFVGPAMMHAGEHAADVAAEEVMRLLEFERG